MSEIIDTFRDDDPNGDYFGDLEIHWFLNDDQFADVRFQTMVAATSADMSQGFAPELADQAIREAQQVPDADLQIMTDGSQQTRQALVFERYNELYADHGDILMQYREQ